MPSHPVILLKRRVNLAWQDNSCYQLVSRIAFPRFEVYEPGTISRFTDEAMRRLQEDLPEIASTFELPPAAQ